MLSKELKASISNISSWDPFKKSLGFGSRSLTFDHTDSNPTIDEGHNEFNRLIDYPPESEFILFDSELQIVDWFKLKGITPEWENWIS